uniref:1-phosphatidylinositol 3-phosphate 5-kinase n=1 Tax=Euperipatoides kanangrensis TaxID=488523 RepID=A0A0F7VKH6_9BILA|nr:Eka-PIP kinase protein [Euperipatoides kanangrensis]
MTSKWNISGQIPDENMSSLTEFAPLSSDSRPQGPGFSFAKFFRKSRENSRENSPSHSRVHATIPEDEISDLLDNATEEILTVTEDGFEQRESSTTISRKDNIPFAAAEDINPKMSVGKDILYTRTLTSVLRRISNILDRRSSTPQAYKDSDFKQYWMPDSNCKECYDCGDKFTTFRRRHHCRVCGQIFCSRCCNQEIPGKLMGYTGELRVCKYCCKVVLGYIQSAEATPEAASDLRSLQEEIYNRLEGSETISDSSSQETFTRRALRRKTSLGFREEDFAKLRFGSNPDIPSMSSSGLFDITPQTEFNTEEQMLHERKILIQDSTQLKSLWLQIQHPVNGVEMQNHRLRLRTYPNCLVGSELVDWLISQNKASSRAQSVVIGQALVDAKYLECVSNQDQVFRDEYAFYRPIIISNCESPAESTSASEQTESHEEDEPLWFKEIRSMEEEETDENESAKTHRKSDWVSQNNTEEVYKKDISIANKESTGEESPKLEDESYLPKSNSTFYLELDVDESKVSVRAKKSLDAKRYDRNSKEANRSTDSYKVFQDTSHLTINEDFLLGALFANVDTYEDPEDFVISKSWFHRELHVENGEQLAFERFSRAYKNHVLSLVKQLLSSSNLSSSWADIIVPLVKKVSETVRPDVRHENDDMDIRQYVSFKKIPGGSKRDCNIINGVVCSKNLAHKKMLLQIQSPKILLLGSALEYQRVENKLSSIDPVILQEHEYLKNCAAKVAALKPDILLVEKTVSRLAQNFLLQHGITLVLNVKSSVMERVARCTQADIVSTIDGQITRPRLGFCHQFRVQNYTLPDGQTKTLMVFDGCATHLACTVTLRGASAMELKKVKKIVQFMVYVAYNWHLELSFLMDEFALPPPIIEESPIIDDPDELRNLNKLSVNCSYQDSKNDIKEEEKLLKKLHNSLSDSNRNEKSSEVNDSKETSGVGEVTKELLDDFSDPLHSYQISQDDSIFQESVQLCVESISIENCFRKALNDTILSCSPFVRFTVPYLESEAGHNCPLQKYFPKEIYWSAQFFKDTIQKKSSQMDNHVDEIDSTICDSKHIEILQPHPFVFEGLSSSLIDPQVQASLADFRARGGRIRRLCPHEINERNLKNGKLKEQIEIGKIVRENGFTSSQLENKMDCLDPFNHQRLAVLFCSYAVGSTNSPSFCVSPWVVNMDFYGRNDITVGGFLERYCFRSTYMCPNEACETSMVDHIRKFVHANGCVHILLKKLDAPIPRSSTSILMWSWCRICEQVSPLSPMSLDAWSFSFAKYLQLRFHGNLYERRSSSSEQCFHSLHHDHFQYFGYKDMVASFKYTLIVLREIVLPPMMLSINLTLKSVAEIIEDIKVLAVKGSQVYSDILDRLRSLKSECSGSKYEHKVNDFFMQQKNEHGLFREKIEEIQLKLVSPTLQNSKTTSESSSGNSFSEEINIEKDAQTLMWNILDCIVNCKIMITEAVLKWNNKMHDFFNQKKKDERTRSSSMTSMSKTIARESASSVDHLLPLPVCESPSGSSKCSSQENLLLFSSEDQDLPEKDIQECFNADLAIRKIQQLQLEKNLEEAMQEEAASEHSSYTSLISDSSFNDNLENSVDSSRSKKLIDVFIGSTEITASSSQLRLDEIDNSLKSIDGDYKPRGRGHQRSWSDGSNKISFDKPKIKDDEPTENIRSEKKSVKNILSQFLSGSSFSPLSFPFPAEEHYLLPPYDKLPIVIYDQEPSSIIAYALSSSEYEAELQEMKHNLLNSQKDSQNSSPTIKKRLGKFPATSNQPGNSSRDSLDGSTEQQQSMGKKAGVLSFFRGSSTKDSHFRSSKNSSSLSGVDAVQYIPGAGHRDSLEEVESDYGFYSSTEIEKNKLGKQASPNFHIELQFSDNVAKFYCRVYFAEQFCHLRNILFPGGEERYIRSLSRCFHWMARGGKSGSAFCKTLDERFILKQMSRLEVQSFVEFASHYIDYMTKAYKEQRPTVLAKILGVYRIGYRNSHTNTAAKQDLLVMENLFYGHKISQIFDLKGSIRNRLVNTSGKQDADLVLLDENLLKLSIDNPLYIRPHSKTILTLAINNDTQFLSNHLIMDYSLLVGLDELKKELVVGIIDYIRTFTWDKKVEMVVKSTGFLGGQGKTPTILSPVSYRTRFCEAMDRYFLLVPDLWCSLGKGVDC